MDIPHQHQTEPATSVPPQEKTTQSHYDYPQILPMLEEKGKELFGSSFHFQTQDHPLIIQLTAYFLRDQTTCDQAHISLDKGLLLSGPIGCGKTTLITLMRYITQPVNKYFIKSCRDISFEFIQDGYEVIHRYSKGKLYEPSTRNYCFDDLGVENNLKYYGNECNIMAEIILSRYDLYISRQLQTHITTNLSASEIEAYYGNRVRSRMRELFNLIAFPNDARDKRK
ncbi:ATPase [Sphingobacterium spiritivorum]|uniref:ATPase n=1 Tax=Sphingobacterium spiritivorum TaxID=258 RepID=UPI003DA4FFA7